MVASHGALQNLYHGVSWGACTVRQHVESFCLVQAFRDDCGPEGKGANT